jgi:hypothetical protein
LREQLLITWSSQNRHTSLVGCVHAAATREHSSVGRALPLQGRGQQFESACSHTMRSWQATSVVGAASEPRTSNCVRRWGETPVDTNGDCRKDQHRQHTGSTRAAAFCGSMMPLCSPISLSATRSGSAVAKRNTSSRSFVRPWGRSSYATQAPGKGTFRRRAAQVRRPSQGPASARHSAAG